MTRPLAVVVPSRGRPGNVADLVQAWVATSTGDAVLVVAVDDDDPELGGYLDLGLAAREPDITLLVQAAPGSMVAALNAAARDLARRHFAVGFLGDDHRPRTAGWDGEVVDVLRELGTGLVYGNDLLQGENLPTAVFMTSDIIRRLGHMVPPTLQHLYVDDTWKAWGQGLDRLRYLPDVVIEHLHPVAGKAPMDAGYARVNHPSVYARDQAMFARYLQTGIADDLAAMKALL